MKTVIYIFLTILSPFLAFADDGVTFTMPFRFKAPILTEKERAKDTCYKLARQGQYVTDMKVETPWYQSTDKYYVYRITKLSSGFACKELIEGRVNLQWGSVDFDGCACEGQLQIVK